MIELRSLYQLGVSCVRVVARSFRQNNHSSILRVADQRQCNSWRYQCRVRLSPKPQAPSVSGTSSTMSFPQSRPTAQSYVMFLFPILGLVRLDRQLVALFNEDYVRSLLAPSTPSSNAPQRGGKIVNVRATFGTDSYGNTTTCLRYERNFSLSLWLLKISFLSFPSNFYPVGSSRT